MKMLNQDAGSKKLPAEGAHALSFMYTWLFYIQDFFALSKKIPVARMPVTTRPFNMERLRAAMSSVLFHPPCTELP